MVPQTYNQPKNPITTSSAKQLYQAQSRYPLETIHLDDIAKGVESLAARMDEAVERGARILVCDSVSMEDMEAIVDALIAAKLKFIPVDPGVFTSTCALSVFLRMEANSSRLPSPVSPGRKPVESRITPMSRGNLPFSILSPPTKTSPASGRAKPHIIFNSTLFPEPFSPKIPQMSPRGTVRFKPVNSTLFLYAFDTFRSSTIFLLILPVLLVLPSAVPVLRQPDSPAALSGTAH